MIALVAKRILATVPVLGVVALVVFLMLRLSGDPAAILAGDTASPQQVEQVRVALGLDRPIHEQFVTWIGQILRLDLGRSLFTGLPVTTLIAQRLEPTVMLALTTIAFSVLVAVPLGVLAAWKSGTWIDRR
jgi:peptide/nickel transport system permease protein